MESERLYDFFREVIKAHRGEDTSVSITIGPSVIREMRAVIDARDAFRQQKPDGIDPLPEDFTWPKSGYR